MSDTVPIDPVDPAEVAALRKRVAELEAAQASPGSTSAVVRPSRWRTASAIVLFLLGALLLPIGVVGQWADRTVNDTDRYVSTVGPLIVDQNVQNLLADRITDALLDQVDVEAIIAEAVPRAEPLSGALENGMRSFIRGQVLDLLDSEAASAAWTRVNAVLQERLISALRGEPSGAVSIDGNTVVLDTGLVFEEVKRLLVERGFTFVEKVPVPGAAQRDIVLLESDQISTISRIYQLADIATSWMLWIAFGLLGLAVLVGLNRRRWTMAVGVVFVVASSALWISLNLMRESLLTSRGVGDDSFEASVFDIVTRYLEGMLRAGLAIGIVLIVIGWLVGPAGVARGLRAAAHAAEDRTAGALDRYVPQVRPVGQFIRSTLQGWRVAIVAVAAVSLLGRADLSAGRIFWTVVVALIGWLLVDLLAAWPTDDDAAGTEIPSAADAPASVG